MDNLPLLRDIHLPQEGVSIFPLAHGWWMILCVSIAIYLLIRLFFLIKKTSAKIYARHLLQPLKNDYSVRAVVKMSEILRRICVRKYPEAVAYTGQQWIDFLNSKSKNKINERVAMLLNNAPFVRDNDKEYVADRVDRLWQFCYSWIGENL